MIRSLVFLLGLVCLIWANDSEPESLYDTVVFPIFGYQEDAGFTYGVMSSIYQTQKDTKYRLMLMGAKIGYKLKLDINSFKFSDGWAGDLNVNYTNWEDPYFGQGNQTRLDDETVINTASFSGEIDVKRKLIDHHYLIIGTALKSRKEFSTKNNNQQFFPNITLAGPKLGYKFDTRNRRINTEDGVYVKAQFKLLGAYFVSELDARFFMSLNDDVLASRFFYGAVSGSNVPYILHYKLGSSHELRGLSQNRISGIQKYGFQQEYRRSVWRYLDLSGFLELGRVASTFTMKDWHFIYGIGFHIYFSKEKKQALRINLAKASDEKRVTFGFNHAF